MKETCSCETFIEFQRTTRRYITDDSTLHKHYCENFESYGCKLYNINFCIESLLWQSRPTLHVTIKQIYKFHCRIIFIQQVSESLILCAMWRTYCLNRGEEKNLHLAAVHFNVKKKAMETVSRSYKYCIWCEKTPLSEIKLNRAILGSYTILNVEFDVNRRVQPALWILV
jgi:hypothetical protein